MLVSVTRGRVLRTRCYISGVVIVCEMRWLVVAGLLVALAKYGEGGDTEWECQAGSVWQSNCHSCRCSENGVAKCLRLDDCEHIGEPIRCKPRSSFARDCNTCTCLDNGQVLCTLRMCLDQGRGAEEEVEDEEENLVEGVECAVGTHWKSQCNSCGCSAPGNFYCTRMECDPKEFRTDEPLKRCAPGSSWKHECNTCGCTDDGQHFCTRKACFKPIEVAEKKPVEDSRLRSSETDFRIIKQSCRPHEVFELDCNLCHCSADGQSFSCTRRACPELEDDKNSTLIRKTRGVSPPEPPKACLPGQEFRMDCNKCLCDNEGQNFSCTRIDCAALNNNNYNNGSRRKRDTKEVSAECTPGSVFEQGCSVCRCTQDGRHATCALKRCAATADDQRQEAPASAPGFRCNPGEQFRRDCNDCTCSADGRGVLCTIRLCDEDLTPTI